jgi:hypothetical protein
VPIDLCAFGINRIVACCSLHFGVLRVACCSVYSCRRCQARLPDGAAHGVATGAGLFRVGSAPLWELLSASIRRSTNSSVSAARGRHMIELKLPIISIIATGARCNPDTRYNHY